MYKPSEVTSEERLLGILLCGANGLVSLEQHLNVDFDIVSEKRIPKRNKKFGYRIVYKPSCMVLEGVLKTLKFYLNDIACPSDCVHGFVKGKGIVTNAQCHLDKNEILNIDIKNFFESISTEMVRNMFEKIGFIPEIADRLSKLCTYKGRLVAGYSTSPTIANIICADMDNSLVEFCNSRNLIYSRYADDLSISGNDVSVMGELTEILISFGFEINDHKTKIFKRGQSQYVTGLTVSDKDYPRVPIRFKKKIRQELYYMEKFGVMSHVIKKYGGRVADYDAGYKELRRVRGWIDFVNSIEPNLAKKQYTQYRDIKKEFNKFVLDYFSSMINN